MRLDYLQLMVYLTDVDQGTHCFSLSPESIDEPIRTDKDAQLRRGIYDLHGPADTCALCNAAVLRAAATRPTETERKTVQNCYDPRQRVPLANDSAIPATPVAGPCGPRNPRLLRRTERAQPLADRLNPSGCRPNDVPSNSPNLVSTPNLRPCRLQSGIPTKESASASGGCLDCRQWLPQERRGLKGASARCLMSARLRLHRRLLQCPPLATMRS